MKINALRIGCALAALAVVTTAGAQEESAADLAARFGARATVLDISLSPGGSQIAYISNDNATREVVYVVDLNGSAEPRALTSFSEPNAEMTECDWANEVWLVCEIVGMTELGGSVPVYFTRLLSVATDGSDPQLLTSRPSLSAYGFAQNGGSVMALDVAGQENRILMTSEFLPEDSRNTRMANTETGLGVESVDVTRNRRTTVVDPDEDAIHYVADETGAVRIKVTRPRTHGRDTGDTQYWYRTPDSNRWILFEGDLSGFSPVAVDAADNVAYGFQSNNGFDALYRVALDGSGTREQVLARSDVDIDHLVRIGRQRRVVGASYATEKRMVEYFDADLASLARRIGAALPGSPAITIADASADERTLLLIAGSDVDPGTAYLLERDGNALSELLPLRDHLIGREMAPMRPVSFPAADGTAIPGYLTMPLNATGPVPAVVMPHGGPGARDEWGFDWMVQFLAARGYAVLQPNFRGSTGYGDAWFGRNGFQAWEIAVGDVNDAGRWLVSEGITTPERLGIVGWSYGGYAALQSQVVDPALYQAVVAIAPVTDLELLVEEARDYTNFGVVQRQVGSGPHVEAGSPAEHAAAFRAPVLLFHGTRDMNVGVFQSRRMNERLTQAGRPVRLVEYADHDHYLDDGQVRSNMLLTIDGFLAEHLR